MDATHRWARRRVAHPRGGARQPSERAGARPCSSRVRAVGSDARSRSGSPRMGFSCTQARGPRRISTPSANQERPASATRRHRARGHWRPSPRCRRRARTLRRGQQRWGCRRRANDRSRREGSRFHLRREHVRTVSHHESVRADAARVKGRVVNISSLNGIVASPMIGAYSMSKHAVEAYGDALAGELARFGVRVSLVEPGNYGTEIGRNLIARMDTSIVKGSRFEQQMRATINSMRTFENNPPPDAVADAVLDAMSSADPKARYLVVPVRIRRSCHFASCSTRSSRAFLDRRGVPRRPRDGAQRRKPGRDRRAAASRRARAGRAAHHGRSREDEFSPRSRAQSPSRTGCSSCRPTASSILHPLPVERLWGVGPVTSTKLRPRHRHRATDRATPRARPRRSARAGGRPAHPRPRPQPRSTTCAAPPQATLIGSQRARGRRPWTRESVDADLVALVDRVTRRMRAADRVGRTVVLRLRFDDYTRATRSHTLRSPTAGTLEILTAARDLLRGIASPAPGTRADARRDLRCESRRRTRGATRAAVRR